jgi:hypothetical protein
MGGPAQEAVSAAGDFAAEHLLGVDSWADGAPAVMERFGVASEVHRVFLYRNVRDPDGRLWMDLACEWESAGTRKIFETPGNHLHPFAPGLRPLDRSLGLGPDDRLRRVVAAARRAPGS